MKIDQLLQLFIAHQNEWVSGNQLAESLDISRTMIWKLIKQLKEQGHQIESKTNSGYKYIGNDELNAQLIQDGLDAEYDVIVKKEITSTNSFAKQLNDQNHDDKRHLIIAEKQTQGYGRRGRSFYSPEKSGLYMSMLVPFHDAKNLNPGLLTTMTAVVVAKALKKMYPEIDFYVKWINDIYVNNKKVVGILTELVMDAELMQPSAIVVGIGISLNIQDIPDELKDKVGSISDKQINKNRLVDLIVNGFEQEFPNYLEANFIEDYQKISFLNGKKVSVDVINDTVEGIVTGIDKQGHLLLDVDGKEVTINNGEVVKVNF
ncbi:biotin--[acetyl-CoA-carboxylase] ligase [Apilactobacillus apinorum]|uniref:biotin--[acetyl-CoA-carboxylase] ligase n=1 Tax=Apilactobacillus apinorum TaxID=1218495 RepID=UPI0030EAFEE2